jgi:tripartite-type tricarboxylate transporter receptor subunit TctC
LLRTGCAYQRDVCVENRPGAGGDRRRYGQSWRDGYTLFAATLPQMAILPRWEVSYDPARDFRLITRRAE